MPIFARDEIEFYKKNILCIMFQLSNVIESIKILYMHWFFKLPNVCCSDGLAEIFLIVIYTTLWFTIT